MKEEMDDQPIGSVWIFNHYAQEPGGPGSTRHFSLATNLIRLGWRVTIIASSVEHGTGRQRLQAGSDYALETLQGVDFVWLHGSAYQGNGSSRIRNMLEYFWAASRIGRLNLASPDIVIGSSVHPLAALAASINARRLGVPFIFEVRDLWPETLIAMGSLTRNHPVAIAMRQLERHLYSRAVMVLTLLPEAHRYISSLGISEKKVRWLPNGVDVAAFPMEELAGDSGRPFTFMYIGSHGAANALEPVLQGFARLIEREGAGSAVLRMIGDGPSKPALVELAQKLGVAGSVKFEAPVPKNLVPSLAGEADAFVANVRNLPLYQFGISLNKIYDYLAAGRPVVFASSAVNNPIVEAGVGPAIVADDVDGIAKAMHEVLHMPIAERIEVGRRGRRYVVERHDYCSLAAKLSSWLGAAIKRGARQ